MIAAKFVHCDKCEDSRPPEGGARLSPTRWYCQRCWINRIKNVKTPSKIKVTTNVNAIP